MKTNWKCGQKILCVSIDGEDANQCREMEIGKQYRFRSFERVWKGEMTLSTDGAYIHNVKNFISLPDEINRGKS